ncbi:hypothetical protein [Tunicatimonas pelagia]|uniref:hypothetical protein n=1 Tax=Tunicatimonas pelagia TaxID=931531 RepID=UPI002666E930|nr:hypothetical protein [Tunicatimonas pelagia]WKN45812.1 hypothetical protein P0M28_12670 [Tunicatimonas pelagia]
MVINGIFAIVNGSLLSVRFEGNERDEFARLFEQWQDIEYLENFFESNKDDLQNGFFGNISIEDAVFTTTEEADELENHIQEVAKKGQEDDYSTLYDLIFHPLHANDVSTSHIESKAYGLTSKSWLRVYAIQIATNLYVVSGGAIKLTKAMQDRPHTIEELKKLRATASYLKEIGLEGSGDYGYIDIQTS